MPLLEWQRHVLDDWCAADQWWRPSYTTCGLDVPRQNGKNAALEAYELYRLAVCGWHVLHTAHRVKTAKKAFRRLCRHFEDDAHPELKELVAQIRRTNGEEAIYLTNGGSIEFIARTNGSARGFDDIQLVVFDEAQELTDEQFDAIMYTLAASATGERFDYQLDRHCSKTCRAPFPSRNPFDYQLDRHCSKTSRSSTPTPRGFDYQLDRHCSKTSSRWRAPIPRFDYQLDRHCSKTTETRIPSISTFDYQLD